MAGRWIRDAVLKSLDLDYPFKPVNVADFNQLIFMVRCDRRNRIDQRTVTRGPVTLGTVYLLREEPIAFLAADGQHYLRAV